MVKLLSGIAGRATLIAALVTAPIAGGSALAAPKPEVVANAKTLLSGFEKVPTAADWARVGAPAEVAEALMALAGDARVVTAARATASLGHFARPEVKAFLVTRLADTTRPATLRGKAAIALAGAFGDEVAPAVAPLLASPDPELREDAIRALERLRAPAVERFLRARASRDPVARLGERMRQAADRMAAERARGAAPDPTRVDLPDLKDPGPVAP